METKRIMILGVGNLLFSDEGVGVRVAESLQDHFDFSNNVRVVDGGTLGIHLLSVISEADYLIIVDAVRNGGEPGTLYRLAGDEIPKRILAKNSLHQVDLLETLTCCQALDNVPETVIIGIEPQDITTLGVELTPAIRVRKDDLIHAVLAELDKLGETYYPKEGASCTDSEFARKI